MYRKLVIQTLLLGVALLPACIAQDAAAAATATDSPDAAEGNLAQNTPPIHLRQTSVVMLRGKPSVQHIYEMELTACEHITPPITVTPIGAGDVAKLGRTYVDAWYQGTSMSVQADTWGFEIDSYTPCTFRTTHISEHWLRRAGLKSARYQQGKDANAHILYTEGARKILPNAVVTAADKEQDAEVDATLRKLGYGFAITKSEGTQRVAGQMCTVYVNVVMRYCKWTAGSQWGFDGDNTVSGGIEKMFGANSYAGTIHLWEKSVGGDGGYLTTQSFSVGKLFDAKVFAVPAHPR